MDASSSAAPCIIQDSTEDSELLLDVSEFVLSHPHVAALLRTLRNAAAETLRGHYYNSMLAGSWFNVLPTSLLNAATAGGGSGGGGSGGGSSGGSGGGGGNTGGGGSNVGGGSGGSDFKKQQQLGSAGGGNKPLWRFCRLAASLKMLHISREFVDPPAIDAKPKPEDMTTTIEHASIKDIRVSTLPQLIAQQLGLLALSTTVGTGPLTSQTRIGAGGAGGCDASCSGSGTAAIAIIAVTGGSNGESVLAELVCTSPRTACEWTDGMRQLIGRPMSNTETMGLVSAVSAVQLRARLVGLPAGVMCGGGEILQHLIPVIPPLPNDTDFHYNYRLD